MTRLAPASFLIFALSMSADAGFAEGYRDFKAGRLEAAEYEFVQAADNPQTPADWNLWFLSLVRLAKGDTLRAVDGLERLADQPGSLLQFRARERLARIWADAGKPWSAGAHLLALADNPTHGPEALFLAGEYSLVVDSGESFRIWEELLRRYPRSPFAHRAALRILESNSARDLDPYTALSMARAAHVAGDNITAQAILEAMDRRPVDRRLRDDLLLLHGDVLFKLSRYQDAFNAYREARFITSERRRQTQAYAGMIKSRLYLGEEIQSDLVRKLEVDGEPIVVETLEVVAALRRAQGDPSARALLELTDVPTFELFLDRFWRGDIRAASEIAEYLQEKDDRSLAFALLAENAGSRSKDSWRSLIFETANDYLLGKAADALRKDTTAGNSEEAARLYATALRSAERRDTALALRQLRVVAYGYPGTPASDISRQTIREIAATFFHEPDLASCGPAEMLISAGAWIEAAEALAPYPDVTLARVVALEKGGRPSEAISLLESFRRSLPQPVAISEMPAKLVRILYPTPWRAQFKSAADTYRVDKITLTALARVQTGFDRSFHEGFRLGIAGIDIDAIEFSNNFPGAPKLSAEELLIPEKAIPFSAWLVRFFSDSLGETLPYRIAAAISTGPANLPKTPRAKTELQWIADIPFRNTRKFVMDFLLAYERYRSVE